VIEIRSARPDDAPTLAAFQVAMAKETEDLALPPDVVARGVAAVFADAGKGRYFVAAGGGQIVGCLLVTPEWSDWRAGTWWWIQSVYVVPAARSQGVFRALYEHVRRQVEEDPGLLGLRLYVDRRNQGAQAAYEQLGMSRDHYDQFFWQKGGSTPST
jgi:GNAT superfamily N-acetyltransferase